MKNIVIITLCFSALLFACKKDKAEVVPPPVPTSNLKALFETNVENAIQNFTINNSTGGTLTGANGTSIYVPAGIFVNGSGVIVDGEVSIELIESLHYSDMVWLNKPTVSDGQLLVSGGQLKITASKAGNKVFLAEGMALNVSIPTDSPDESMALYEGSELEDGTVEWVLLEGEVVEIIEDSVLVEVYNFDFINPDLGWINCDYPWDEDAPRTTITAELAEVYTPVYTRGFVVFPEINSVLSIFGADPELSTYMYSGIPIGHTIRFVFVSNIDDVYYYGITDPNSVVADHFETVELEESTLEEIEAAIADL